MKELDPVGGGALVAPPPGSTNAFVHEHFFLRAFSCLHYCARGQTHGKVLKDTPHSKSWWKKKIFLKKQIIEVNSGLNYTHIKMAFCRNGYDGLFGLS